MKKLIPKSTATYILKNGNQECDLVKLAKSYSHIGNIPERIGWLKACEISLLAQCFLKLEKRQRSEGKEHG